MGGLKGPSGDLDWMALEKMVSPHIVSFIAGMSPPSDLAGDDMLTWNWSNNGLFSIVDTYTAVAGAGWDVANDD